MLFVGNKVRVLALPPDNDLHWCIEADVVGQIGTVMRVDRYNTVELEDGDQWNFPLNHDGILENIPVNPWNPMGYVPRTIPLRLP